MTIFVAANSGIGSLFTSLGINLQAFITNLLAFLVVVWLLGKYVYPSLIKALDAKKDELEAAVRMEHDAKAALDRAESKAGDVVQEARSSAEEILSAAKAGAAAQLEEARTKASDQAERIIAEAREQLARDVNAARQTLKADTAKLVAAATEAVLDEKLDGSADTKLIGRSLEARK